MAEQLPLHVREADIQAEGAVAAQTFQHHTEDSQVLVKSTQAAAPRCTRKRITAAIGCTGLALLVCALALYFVAQELARVQRTSVASVGAVSVMDGASYAAAHSLTHTDARTLLAVTASNITIHSPAVLLELSICDCEWTLQARNGTASSPILGPRRVHSHTHTRNGPAEACIALRPGNSSLRGIRTEVLLQNATELAALSHELSALPRDRTQTRIHTLTITCRATPRVLGINLVGGVPVTYELPLDVQALYNALQSSTSPSSPGATARARVLSYTHTVTEQDATEQGATDDARAPTVSTGRLHVPGQLLLHAMPTMVRSLHVQAASVAVAVTAQDGDSDGVARPVTVAAATMQAVDAVWYRSGRAADGPTDGGVHDATIAWSLAYLHPLDALDALPEVRRQTANTLADAAFQAAPAQVQGLIRHISGQHGSHGEQSMSVGADGEVRQDSSSSSARVGVVMNAVHSTHPASALKLLKDGSVHLDGKCASSAPRHTLASLLTIPITANRESNAESVSATCSRLQPLAGVQFSATGAHDHARDGAARRMQYVQIVEATTSPTASQPGKLLTSVLAVPIATRMGMEFAIASPFLNLSDISSTLTFGVTLRNDAAASAGEKYVMDVLRNNSLLGRWSGGVSMTTLIPAFWRKASRIDDTTLMYGPRRSSNTWQRQTCGELVVSALTQAASMRSAASLEIKGRIVGAGFLSCLQALSREYGFGGAASAYAALSTTGEVALLDLDTALAAGESTVSPRPRGSVVLSVTPMLELTLPLALASRSWLVPSQTLAAGGSAWYSNANNTHQVAAATDVRQARVWRGGDLYMRSYRVSSDGATPPLVLASASADIAARAASGFFSPSRSRSQLCVLELDGASRPTTPACSAIVSLPRFACLASNVSIDLPEAAVSGVLRVGSGSSGVCAASQSSLDVFNGSLPYVLRSGVLGQGRAWISDASDSMLTLQMTADASSTSACPVRMRVASGSCFGAAAGSLDTDPSRAASVPTWLGVSNLVLSGMCANACATASLHWFGAEVLRLGDITWPASNGQATPSQTRTVVFGRPSVPWAQLGLSGVWHERLQLTEGGLGIVVTAKLLSLELEVLASTFLSVSTTFCRPIECTTSDMFSLPNMRLAARYVASYVYALPSAVLQGWSSILSLLYWPIHLSKPVWSSSPLQSSAALDSTLASIDASNTTAGAISIGKIVRQVEGFVRQVVGVVSSVALSFDVDAILRSWGVYAVTASLSAAIPGISAAISLRGFFPDGLTAASTVFHSNAESVQIARNQISRPGIFDAYTTALSCSLRPDMPSPAPITLKIGVAAGSVAAVASNQAVAYTLELHAGRVVSWLDNSVSGILAVVGASPTLSLGYYFSTLARPASSLFRFMLDSTNYKTPRLSMEYDGCQLQLTSSTCNNAEMAGHFLRLSGDRAQCATFFSQCMQRLNTQWGSAYFNPGNSESMSNGACTCWYGMPYWLFNANDRSSAYAWVNSTHSIGFQQLPSRTVQLRLWRGNVMPVCEMNYAITSERCISDYAIVERTRIEYFDSNDDASCALACPAMQGAGICSAGAAPLAGPITASSPSPFELQYLPASHPANTAGTSLVLATVDACSALVRAASAAPSALNASVAMAPALTACMAADAAPVIVDGVTYIALGTAVDLGMVQG